MIQKLRNSLKKRKVKLFLLFLFCSTAAWFISKLSEPFISKTTLVLEYTNSTEDLMLVNASQKEIGVQLEAVGFQFLRFNFKKKNVVIDLKDVIKEGRQYYLPNQNCKIQIENQLPNSMRLIEMEKDTLLFDFQSIITKEVPVKPVLKLSFTQNYLLDGKLEISPATILVKGPKNEVDTILSVKTDRIDFTDLTSDFSQKTKIQFSDALRHTSFSETAVTVSGKVARFSEKIIPVAIKILNVPNGVAFRTFPDEVNILCKGTLNSLKNLKASDFEVVADFGKVKNLNSKKLALGLRKKSDKISSAILQETEVEYILKREK